VPAVLAAGALTIPAGASASGGAPAHAAGSDAPPSVLPSIVSRRINRGERALDHAGDYVDKEQPAKAVISLRNARRNMYAAWRNAVDVVENTPAPPPPVGDLLGKVVRVVKTKGANVAATYTGPDETAVAVLNFQHDVAGAAYDLIDGAKGDLRDAVSTTIFAALNRRDRAVSYIHDRPVPPAPPGDGLAAHAAGAPVATDTFATLMPGVVPDLDDELGQIRGLVRGGALTPGEKHIMGLAKSQVLETKDTVNTWWPPLPPGD
jgi:hypothetical protein